MANNPALWELHLPGLSAVDDLVFVGNPQLRNIEKAFPLLGKIRHSLTVQDAALVQIKLPVEFVESMAFHNNARLRLIDFPYLTNSVAHHASGNPRLMQFNTAGGDFVLTDPDDLTKGYFKGNHLLG